MTAGLMAVAATQTVALIEKSAPARRARMLVPVTWARAPRTSARCGTYRGGEREAESFVVLPY